MVMQTARQITEKHFLNPNLKNSEQLPGLLHFIPVIAETPEDAAESIENILEDCHSGVEMIIIDKSQSKTL